MCAGNWRARSFVAVCGTKHCLKRKTRQVWAGKFFPHAPSDDKYIASLSSCYGTRATRWMNTHWFRLFQYRSFRLGRTFQLFTEENVAQTLCSFVRCYTLFVLSWLKWLFASVYGCSYIPALISVFRLDSVWHIDTLPSALGVMRIQACILMCDKTLCCRFDRTNPHVILKLGFTWSTSSVLIQSSSLLKSEERKTVLSLFGILSSH